MKRSEQLKLAGIRDERTAELFDVIETMEKHKAIKSLIRLFVRELQ